MFFQFIRLQRYNKKTRYAKKKTKNVCALAYVKKKQ